MPPLPSLQILSGCRKLRSSILRKDLPLLRRAASGSSHMCSFSRPLCREEMEKHIDMASAARSGQ